MLDSDVVILYHIEVANCDFKHRRKYTCTRGLDIKKFNEQYGVLQIAKTNKFHDRFIIIDNK